MLRRLWLALFFLTFASAAWAQGCGSTNPNCIVPTRPAGDSTNAAANTAWVGQNAVITATLGRGVSAALTQPLNGAGGVALTSSLNALTYGMDPTGATNSTTAFNALITAMCAQKRSGYIPSGTYVLTAGVVTDFVSCPYGFKLLGDSHGQTQLSFTGSGTVGWQWKVSGGSGPGNTVPHVFDELGNLEILCPNNVTVCWKLGQDNGADVFESSHFHNMYVSNTYNNSTAIAIRINSANANDWNNIQCGTTPSTTSSNGNGIGMQFVMAAFNTFTSLSCGNSNTGLQFTDLGNAALGFIYGNTFISFDMENVCNGVVLANSANSATGRNNFISGQLYTIGPQPNCPMYSNRMASPSLPDGNVVFQNPNLGSNPPYGASGQITGFSAVAGTGTSGTYTSISLTGGDGTGAVATVTVTSGAVSAVTMTTTGSGYYIGDVLSGTVPTVTGFSATVGSITQPFLDTTGTHWQGVRLLGGYNSPYVGLTAPGSAAGCSTNLFTNKTAQTQREVVTGTFTAICQNGATYGYASGGSLVTMLIIDPGETFGVQYGGAAPVIYQQALTW